MNLRHLWLESLFSTRYAIRSGTGIIFVLAVFYLGLAFGGLALLPVEFGKMMAAQSGIQDFDETQVLNEFIRNTRKPMIYFLGGGSEDAASTEEEQRAWRKADDSRAYLVEDKPALLTFVMAILVVSMPFFISIGCFNTMSGDVQYFALRYQLFRTTRASLFFGRYLGMVTFALLVMLLLMLIEVVYVGFRLDHLYEWGELIPWGFRGAFALVMLTFPYVAICHMISSWVDSPFGSLIICKGVIFIPPAITIAGWWAWKPFIHTIHVLPWGITSYFFHPEMKWVVAAAAASVGYTVLYLAVGYWRFARRDL